VSTDAPAVQPEPVLPESFFGRILDNIKAGNLGSWPVLIGLVVIGTFFSFKADNFLSPGNFSNIITQMAGVTLLAYGVVFVLLIGEIDLSISYISGIAGVVVAQMTLPESGHQVPGLVAILLAVGACVAIGAFQGSFVAFIGVPAFVVTLAGYQIWQGVIQKSIEKEGVIVIQDETVNNTANYFFSNTAGWVIAAIVCGVYAASVVGGVVSHRRAGVAVRDPLFIAVKLAIVVAVTIVTVIICNKDRGVPFVLLLMIAALLILTFVAKRTTFGRHVYAVGGNAEAARRAGINVAWVRISCFMMCSTLAVVGGVLLASRTNSVNPNTGGTLTLLYAVGAAVIGGTSLFGGRGRVLDAILGASVVTVIDNGMTLLNQPQGRVYIITGVVLLLAASVDAISRRRAAASGRV
jgi:D-xylose transport system permease protein